MVIKRDLDSWKTALTALAALGVKSFRCDHFEVEFHPPAPALPEDTSELERALAADGGAGMVSADALADPATSARGEGIGGFVRYPKPDGYDEE